MRWTAAKPLEATLTWEVQSGMKHAHRLKQGQVGRGELSTVHVPLATQNRSASCILTAGARWRAQQHLGQHQCASAHSYPNRFGVKGRRAQPTAALMGRQLTTCLEVLHSHDKWVCRRRSLLKAAVRFADERL